ncbi:hypothetical protein L195_g060058, partial [Trifolium pratense]
EEPAQTFVAEPIQEEPTQFVAEPIQEQPAHNIENILGKRKRLQGNRGTVAEEPTQAQIVAEPTQEEPTPTQETFVAEPMQEEPRKDISFMALFPSVGTAYDIPGIETYAELCMLDFEEFIDQINEAMG